MVTSPKTNIATALYGFDAFLTYIYINFDANICPFGVPLWGKYDNHFHRQWIFVNIQGEGGGGGG